MKHILKTISASHDSQAVPKCQVRMDEAKIGYEGHGVGYLQTEADLHCTGDGL